MKTSTLDGASLISSMSGRNAVTDSKDSKGSGFQSIIDSISSTNQNTKSDLSSSNAIKTSESNSSTKSSEISTPKDTAKDNLNDNSNTANNVSDDISKADKTDNSITDKLDKAALDSDKLEELSKVEITEIQDKLNSKDVLKEYSDKIKEILLNNLNVTEEELELVMAELGINYLDCLDNANLAQLITQISGNADTTALITNEALFQQFTELSSVMTELSAELLDELGITQEELGAMLEQMKQNIKGEHTQTDNRLSTGNETKEADAENTDVKTADTKNIVETAKEALADNAQLKTEQNVKQDKDIVTVLTESDKAKNAKTAADSNEAGHSQLSQEFQKEPSSSKDTAKAETRNDYSNFAAFEAKNINAPNEAIAANTAQGSDSLVNAKSILEQIQNQIKLTAGTDITKMEFQLYPEHLGKLTIQIASKDGAITAHIRAQEQAVKEVLESQIVQLRENMNSQGLKVDAVEVTVESHEFERNLEQGRQNEQEQYEDKPKNSRRQLNYNDLEDIELTEDEEIIAEMMIGNGNSINYMA